MNDEVEVIIDSKELFEFLEQICEYYRVGSQSPFFSERDFINWVVVRAGQMYIKYQNLRAVIADLIKRAGLFIK